MESSNAWNNAGTGHAALCELNYTPENADGSVDISRALAVNTEFDLSRQLWAYLVSTGAIKDPQSFIHSVPHCSFVRGAADVAFLRQRFEALSRHHCYRGMEFSADRKQLAGWFPLVMEGRDAGEQVAATRMRTGTDVDYGALTDVLLDSLHRIKRGSRSTFRRGSRICAAPAIAGRFASETKRPARIGKSRPSSFLSGRAAAHCRFCRSPGSRKGTATQDIR